MTTAWHDTNNLGSTTNTARKKLIELSQNNMDISIQISTVHALSQSALALSALKTTNVLAKDIADIKLLISFIPQQVMASALLKVNEHK